MTSNPDELMDLEQAAAWMKVGADGLRRQAERLEIPARKVDGEWIFSRGAILEWFKAPAAPPSAELLRKMDPEAARQRMFSAFGTSDETEEEAEAFLAEIYARRGASAEERE